MAAAAAAAAPTLPGILPPYLYTTPPPIIPGGKAPVLHPTVGIDPITGQYVYIPEGTILSTEPPVPVPLSSNQIYQRACQDSRHIIS